MTTKKNVEKVTAPNVDITVDITDATCASDVYTAFACAKMDKTLTRDEYNAFVNDIAEANSVITVCYCPCDKCPCCKPKKKPNIFKRIWNWITGK